jgi:hypothetical protein
VLNFLRSQPGCFENLPLHATKTRLHWRKAESVDQLLHRVQPEETDYVSIIATGARFFKARTAVATHGHTCDDSVAISADAFETLVS